MEWNGWFWLMHLNELLFVSIMTEIKFVLITLLILCSGLIVSLSSVIFWYWIWYRFPGMEYGISIFQVEMRNKHNIRYAGFFFISFSLNWTSKQYYVPQGSSSLILLRSWTCAFWWALNCIGNGEWCDESISIDRVIMNYWNIWRKILLVLDILWKKSSSHPIIVSGWAGPCSVISRSKAIFVSLIIEIVCNNDDDITW